MNNAERCDIISTLKKIEKLDFFQILLYSRIDKSEKIKVKFNFSDR